MQDQDLLIKIKTAVQEERNATTRVLHLLREVERKSTRECEKIIRTHMPDAVPLERRRVLTENKTEVKMVLDESTIQMLQKLKELWSHKNPNMTDSELVKAMAEFCLSKLDPMKKEIKKTCPTTKTPAPEVKLASTSRHIPNPIRRIVWKKNRDGCEFIDPLTKRNCGSRRCLEIDHIRPWALGGTHEPSNLRLLCRTHNALRAEQTFGPNQKSAQKHTV